MRYLVISDIHANLEAYDTVMATAAPLGYNRVLVLGDLVGYGADPNAICDNIRALQPFGIIRGNHDKVGSGVESPAGFNAVARNAIHWTYEQLSVGNREWLAALPAGPMMVDDLIEICHGTPFDEDSYVFDDLDALRAMHATKRQLCLFGHTHVQVGHFLSKDEFGLSTPQSHRPLTIRLDEANRYLVNPGSVGQPRDGDPRAAFAMVDTATREVTIHRVEYPVAEAQARIMAEGLPEVLAERLALGR